MRFPSFIRVPRNRRFQIDPRYYDPVKEEIEERTSRIRKEMQGEEQGYLPGRINFERKTTPVPNTSFLQLLIAAILGITVFGWLYYGDTIFYSLWAIVPLYLFFRFKKRFQKPNR